MKMNFLAEVVPYVDFHKERWDGKDNHHNLSGRSIPLGARIVAVADAFHALTQERPYRDTPMSEAEALKVLQAESGKRWDPEVVDSLTARLKQSA
jgi:putative two-component system response regulator